MSTLPPTSKEKGKEKQQVASQNWLSLQKSIQKKGSGQGTSHASKKAVKHEVDVTEKVGESSRQPSISFPRGSPEVDAGPSENTSNGSESKERLAKMVKGGITFTDEQKEPGKYLALDCEMVGVGPNGSESSLARVSLVNYHGAVILDEFVRQRERVTDYRTFVSGIRPLDLANARPFADVQKQVSDLLKDRILVGHAIQNDLRALLLSQPYNLLRDTQLCAGKARILNTKRPSLRKLIDHEFGVKIQDGEHSSMIDARATMALYRLHRKEWEKSFRQFNITKKSKKKRKLEEMEDDGATEEAAASTKRARSEVEEFPGGGRRGVSSGLSTVIKRSVQPAKLKTSGKTDSGSNGGNWWSSLESTTKG